MLEPQVNDSVRLLNDIPELYLQRGQVGKVCSRWAAPASAYEVEFSGLGLDQHTRALLLQHQIEMAEAISG